MKKSWRSIEVVITGLTRNQLGRKPTWVRIPPSPPKKPVANAIGFFHDAIRIASQRAKRAASQCEALYHYSPHYRSHNFTLSESSVIHFTATM